MISIIVPVYNAAEKLDKCLTSLAAQTYEDIEVLLVDDGSTDTSGEVCRRFETQDSRFRYVHKENGGVSSARNVGLSFARGEYVGFCDADDWVEKDAYAFLLNLLEREDADVAICGVVEEKADGTGRACTETEVRLFSGKEALIEMHKGGQFEGYLWNKLFKREIVEGVCLDESVAIYEDMLFLWDVFPRCKKIAYQNVSKYHYVEWETSALHCFRPRFWSAQIACRKMHEKMASYAPEALVWAKRTGLRGNLDLARRLQDTHLLTRAAYAAIKKELSAYYTKDALAKFPAKTATSIRVLHWGRLPYCVLVFFLNARKKRRARRRGR